MTIKSRQMNKERFDFTEGMASIDRDMESLRKEEQERGSLEKKIETLQTLNKGLDEFVGKLEEVANAFVNAVNAMQVHTQKVIPDKAKDILSKETEKACRKLLDEFERKGSALVERMTRNDRRVSISHISFWCMVVSLVILSSFAVLTIVYNERILHDGWLRNFGFGMVGALLFSIVAVVFIGRKIGRPWQ